MEYPQSLTPKILKARPWQQLLLHIPCNLISQGSYWVENILKIHAWVSVLEHAQCFSHKHLKASPWQQFLPDIGLNLISSRSSWIKHILRMGWKSKGIKSFTRGAPVARYSQNPTPYRSFWVKHILKIWSKANHGFRLWNTNNRPPLGQCRGHIIMRVPTVNFFIQYHFLKILKGKLPITIICL